MTDTNYTDRQIANAELVPNMGSGNTLFVRFGPEDYGNIPKTGKNRLLLREDLDLDGDALDVGNFTVVLDLERDEYRIKNNELGETVRVPHSSHEHVLWAVGDADESRLRDLFDKFHVPTVRIGLMDQMLSRFRESGEVKKTDDGWLFNQDTLLRWDGENRLTDIDQIHERTGSMTKPVERDATAVDIDFELGDEPYLVEAPWGNEFELREIEMKFLVTAAMLSDNYGTYSDDLDTAVQQSRATGYTNPRSGLHHGHSLDKHRVGDLGVTDAASEMLWYGDNCHASVHELAAREQEFRNAEMQVFEDVPNENDARWSKIRSVRQNAPVPSKVTDRLDSMYN